MGRSNTESSGDSVSQALKLRWKFQLSNLVYAISNQANPIALVFEDLQWAHTDALGKLSPNQKKYLCYRSLCNGYHLSLRSRHNPIDLNR